MYGFMPDLDVWTEQPAAMAIKVIRSAAWLLITSVSLTDVPYYDPKFLDGHIWADSVDPDQRAV